MEEIISKQPISSYAPPADGVDGKNVNRVDPEVACLASQSASKSAVADSGALKLSELSVQVSDKSASRKAFAQSLFDAVKFARDQAAVDKESGGDPPQLHDAEGYEAIRNRCLQAHFDCRKSGVELARDWPLGDAPNDPRNQDLQSVRQRNDELIREIVDLIRKDAGFHDQDGSLDYESLVSAFELLRSDPGFSVFSSGSETEDGPERMTERILQPLKKEWLANLEQSTEKFLDGWLTENRLEQMFLGLGDQKSVATEDRIDRIQRLGFDDEADSEATRVTVSQYRRRPEKEGILRDQLTQRLREALLRYLPKGGIPRLEAMEQLSREVGRVDDVFKDGLQAALADLAREELSPEDTKLLEKWVTSALKDSPAELSRVLEALNRWGVAPRFGDLGEPCKKLVTSLIRDHLEAEGSKIESPADAERLLRFALACDKSLEPFRTLARGEFKDVLTNLAADHPEFALEALGTLTEEAGLASGFQGASLRMIAQTIQNKHPGKWQKFVRGRFETFTDLKQDPATRFTSLLGLQVLGDVARKTLTASFEAEFSAPKTPRSSSVAKSESAELRARKQQAMRDILSAWKDYPTYLSGVGGHARYVPDLIRAALAGINDGYDPASGLPGYVKPDLFRETLDQDWKTLSKSLYDRRDDPPIDEILMLTLGYELALGITESDRKDTPKRRELEAKVSELTRPLESLRKHKAAPIYLSAARTRLDEMRDGVRTLGNPSPSRAGSITALSPALAIFLSKIHQKTMERQVGLPSTVNLNAKWEVTGDDPIDLAGGNINQVEVRRFNIWGTREKWTLKKFRQAAGNATIGMDTADDQEIDNSLFASRLGEKIQTIMKGLGHKNAYNYAGKAQVASYRFHVKEDEDSTVVKGVREKNPSYALAVPFFDGKVPMGTWLREQGDGNRAVALAENRNFFGVEHAFRWLTGMRDSNLGNTMNGPGGGVLIDNGGASMDPFHDHGIDDIGYDFLPPIRKMILTEEQARVFRALTEQDLRDAAHDFGLSRLSVDKAVERLVLLHSQLDEPRTTNDAGVPKHGVVTVVKDFYCDEYYRAMFEQTDAIVAKLCEKRDGLEKDGKLDEAKEIDTLLETHRRRRERLYENGKFGALKLLVPEDRAKRSSAEELESEPVQNDSEIAKARILMRDFARVVQEIDWKLRERPDGRRQRQGIHGDFGLASSIVRHELIGWSRFSESN